MPMPPAIVLARLAIGAAALYAASRALPRHARDQRAEDALDRVAEGAAVSRDEDGLRAAGRWRRQVRLGRDGPGVDIDLTGLARMRLRRL